MAIPRQRGLRISASADTAFITDHTDADDPSYLDKYVDAMLAADEGDRHHTACQQLCFAFRSAIKGKITAKAAHDEIHAAFLKVKPDPAPVSDRRSVEARHRRHRTPHAARL